MARWRDGAEGVVATTALDNALDGLNSLNGDIRLATWELLRALVGHESTVQAVVAIVPREDLVALVRYDQTFLLLSQKLTCLVQKMEQLGLLGQ
jgi:hypothetical protein